MKRALLVTAGAITLSLGSSAFGLEIVNEDFTDPAWRHPTDQLFSSPNYPLMVDGVNGWTVSQGPGLPSGSAIKLRTDKLEFVNSFWENGPQSPDGDNPTGISRSDLPNLVDGDFSFGWRDGFNSHSYWQVQLKDCLGRPGVTIRHDRDNGNVLLVNGVLQSGVPDNYSATGALPTFIKVSWDLNAGTVTLDELLDGPGGFNVSDQVPQPIQHNAGLITTFELITGNRATGSGGGMEMVGSIEGGANDFGTANGLIINGTPVVVTEDCFLVRSISAEVDGKVAAQFQSEVGITYLLQCTTDPPASNNWSDTGAFVAGDGSTLLLFDPSGYSTGKTYRVFKASVE
jgi:hypothetical protein